MLRVVKYIVTIVSSGILLSINSNAAGAVEKHIYGLHENIYIAEIDSSLPAKLDTGASTSSISAIDIQEFDKNGDAWVRFRLHYKNAPKDLLELPIARTSRVKRRADDYDSDTQKGYSARPVVEMKITLGGTTKMVEVSLTDRSAFKYPFLMGSKALREFKIIVDPSARFTIGKKETTK